MTNRNRNDGPVALHEKLLTLVRPLLQELDGASRAGDAERIGRIAARLLGKPSDTRELLLFTWLHPIASWLGKPGNFSRAVLGLSPEVTERELLEVLDVSRSLPNPKTPLGIAFASALAIDGAGVRGTLALLARARREGLAIDEAVDNLLAEPVVAPPFLSEHAVRWFAARRRKSLMFLELAVKERQLSDRTEDEDAQRDAGAAVLS